MAIELAETPYIAPQGEGRTLGRPALFVRVRGCPLACRWCDSKFTWKTAAEGPTLGKMPPAELGYHMFEIARHGPHFPPTVVFTGGEPLIYQNDLPSVIRAYRAHVPRRVDIEVETAGTIMPRATLMGCDFNVSPKLASAGNANIPLATLWNWEATKRYLWLSPRSIFKLVVDQADEHSLQAYLSWLKDCAASIDLPWEYVRSRVYLMPAATTQNELAAAQGHVIELATEHGVNVTTRLHVLAYGNERGR